MRSVHDAKLFSESKVARIEAGKMPVRVGDVWALCRFYNVDNALTDALVNLSEGTRSDGWWEDYGPGVPRWFDLYLGLEETCSVLSTYHPELVHGVLQTENYARAVIATDGSTGEIVSRRLSVRSGRRRGVLDRPDRTFRAVLGEGALSLVVGSAAVMAEQIAHLRRLNAAPRIDIRVLPRTAGAHPGTHGRFTVMDFEDDADPSVVYLESLMGARYLERSHQVAAYHRSFRLLTEKSVPIEEFTP